MARVTLHRSHADRLPPVCTSCGQPATAVKRERYRWNPAWVWVFLFVGLLPWVALMWLTGRSAELAMPVCGRHARRGRRSLKVLVAGFALAAAVTAVGSVLYPTDPGLGGDVMMGAVAVLVVAGLVAWAVPDCPIAATAIDDRSVTLDGVSDGFAAALAGKTFGVPAGWGASGGVELTTAKYLRV